MCLCSTNHKVIFNSVHPNYMEYILAALQRSGRHTDSTRGVHNRQQQIVAQQCLDEF